MADRIYCSRRRSCQCDACYQGWIERVLLEMGRLVPIHLTTHSRN